MKASLASCGRLFAFVFMAGGLLAAVPAHAQMESREAIALQNQILELRHQLDVLSQSGGVRSGYAPQAPAYGYPPPASGANSDAVASLLDRVSALEEQVRSLRGRIEEIQNTQQQQYQDLAKQIGDINFKLQNTSAGAPAAAPPSVPAGPAAASGGLPLLPGQAAPAQTHPTPEVLLQDGNAALARRDYAAAEAAARQILANAKGPRTTDAQFLLAQSLAGQRNYQAAAVAYDDSYKRAPTGAHAQDSLLGIALSLNALGMKKESCEALAQLRTTFPTPRADLREPISTARERAGCR